MGNGERDKSEKKAIESPVSSVCVHFLICILHTGGKGRLMSFMSIMYYARRRYMGDDHHNNRDGVDENRDDEVDNQMTMMTTMTTRMTCDKKS